MEETVLHEIEPVWNSESQLLLLGTMPSPASRKAGFFYMHPQNRFWKVLPAVFGEKLVYPNNSPDSESAIRERREFLLRNKIALWDVLSACSIEGAADSSIKNAEPNDFTEILEKSKIRLVFCTGKTAFNFWNKFCASRYEEKFGLKCGCLPSTSPANAAWNLEKLIEAYGAVKA
ncbi:MAG: DNA-deoxyinosine glycosylase [Treponema sp.]|nr:DNA-deoxyinosine glycosylase [Treponema sp.]